MSYILDALKKLEQEKSRKTGKAGISVTGELFRPEKHVYGRDKQRMAVVTGMVLLIAAAGIFWYLQSDSGQTVREAGTIPAGRPVVVQPPPPARPAVTEPVQAAASNVAQAVTSAVQPDMKAGPQPFQPQRTGEGAARRQQPAAADATTAMPVAAPPVDLKLSGIAWQEARSARRAVINGYLYKEGATVSGARVVEILPEKVRFSLSGRTFEVAMQTSITAGSNK